MTSLGRDNDRQSGNHLQDEHDLAECDLIRLLFHQEFIVARGRATDGNRLLASRAIADGASTGNGNTELTLISQST